MEEVPFLAYKLARELHRNYPELWDKNKKAGSMVEEFPKKSLH